MGKGFYHKKQKGCYQKAPSLPCAQGFLQQLAGIPLRPTLSAVRDEAAHRHRSILVWSKALWSSDYRPLLAAEREAGSSMLLALDTSSYRKRLQGSRAELYDQKAAARAGSITSLMIRATNQQRWPFSTVARSLSFYNQRVPNRVWLEEQSARRLASRESLRLLLREMLKQTPDAEFVVHPNIFVSCADQTLPNASSHTAVGEGWVGSLRYYEPVSTSLRVPYGSNERYGHM